MNTPLIVGIAGGTGSGKSTLATILAQELEYSCAIVPLDRFYVDLSHLTPEQREHFNFDHPSAIHASHAASLVSQLQRKQPAQLPVYSFELNMPTGQTEVIHPAEVILVEGIFALHFPELLQLYDTSLFLQIDDDVRLERKIERDIRERGRTRASVKEAWNRFAAPMHKQFILPSGAHAQLRFTESFADQVVGVTTERIELLLQQRRVNGY